MHRMTFEEVDYGEHSRTWSRSWRASIDRAARDALFPPDRNSSKDKHVGDRETGDPLCILIINFSLCFLLD